MTGGRFLGIDYGTKRIGLALSDEDGKLAFPKEVIENNKNTSQKIKEVIKNEAVAEIVVGESVNFSGQLNTVGKEIEIFIRKLEEECELPIHTQKEFLTSVEARRYSSKNRQTRNTVDASAAALILQRYLDKKNQPQR